MLNYIIISIYLCLSIVACDPDYMHFGDVGWLKLIRKPATWAEAHERCIREGAELISPTRLNIVNAMFANMKNQNLQCGVHTGIHDTYTPGELFSLSGIPLEKMDLEWKKSSTCPAQSGDTVIMFPEGTVQLGFRSEKHSFICHMEHMNQTYENKCGIPDYSYTFDSRTGSCYKFHRDAKTWDDAQKTCTSENAHLVIINSDTEGVVLKDLFKKNPDTVISADIKNYALVGVRDWGHTGRWLTLYGQTLDNAGHAEWGEKQPDQQTSDKSADKFAFCGAFSRNEGKLANLWCDIGYAFICEKPGRVDYEDHSSDRDLTLLDTSE